MELTPKVLKEAKRQAFLFSNRIRLAYQRSLIKSWADIETRYQVQVPDNFKSQPFNWSTVGAGALSFCNYWEVSYEIRLQGAISNLPAECKIVSIQKTSTFGEVTLKPEQQGAFEAAYVALFGDLLQLPNRPQQSENVGMFDWFMGAGKTIGVCALIARSIKDGILNHKDVFWRPHPFIIFVPPAVQEQWRREIERFGLGDYLNKRLIYVFPDSEFVTDNIRLFLIEEEDIYNEGQVTLKWNPPFTPIFCCLDEYQRYNNPRTKRTKTILALFHSKFTKKFICTSATPMEKVNDSFLFTVLAKKTFQGVKVDESTFNFFAKIIDQRPDKANREAMKRLRQVLAPNFFSVPYIKPKYKAINIVEPVAMPSPKAQEIYDSAITRYQEVCRKVGRDPNAALQERIALNILRKTVEPLRADYLSDRAFYNYRTGNFATAIFAAYKETIATVAFKLIEHHKIPRDKISVVWGGRKEYKKEELLSAEMMDKIFKSKNPLEYLKDETTFKRAKLTIKYIEDGFEHLESNEEQTERHIKLREYRLVGKQSKNVRQVEIDKFQSGESLIILCTIATGGLGLNLDRDKPQLLPREGLFTPIYSGKEFRQALGRLVRRMSISDAIQRICLMADTVEEWHVAPILDTKLKCIAEITNRNFDIVELLKKESKAEHFVKRDVETAAKDADADNTVVSDFVSDAAEEDEEEEEVTT